MKKYYVFILLGLLFNFTNFSQQLPLDFSNSNQSFVGFSGSEFSFRSDIADNSNTVGQFFNDGSNANQGFYIDLTTAVDLEIQQKISLRFYAFDPNAHKIIIKLEQGDATDIAIEQTVDGLSPSNWQTISFDFSEISGNYNRLTIFIDQGTTTPGTYLIDDISDGSALPDPNALDIEYTDLVWSDEFDTNGAIDANKWFHQTLLPPAGNGSWFNGEEQHYTNRLENSYVEDGFLNIVALKEEFTDQGVTKSYTSARLNSKFAFTYGRVDIRAKLPFGNGTWPAIWTLGKNINEDGGFWDEEFGTTSWPNCGEIDIMEHGLHDTNKVSSALHSACSGCFGGTRNTATLPLENVADNFHIYSLNWSPNQITFLVDNVAYYTYRPSVQDDGTWPFYRDQYLLLNIAMGGYSGTIDANYTQSSMVIDYVRVYQNNSLSVSNIAENKLSVYPNPANNFVFIKTNKIIEKVEFYTTLGQLVFSENFPIDGKIDLTNFTKGMYLVKIYMDNKTALKRIVVE